MVIGLQREVEFMSNTAKKIITAYGLGILAIIILGFIWSNIDKSRITEIDIKTQSEYVTHSYSTPLNLFLPTLRDKMKDDRLFIFEEKEISSSHLEFMAYVEEYWINSEFMNKITVLDTIAVRSGSGDKPQQTILVYSGAKETGSKEFIFLSLLVLLLIPAIGINTKFMPHIFNNDQDN